MFKFEQIASLSIFLLTKKVIIHKIICQKLFKMNLTI